MGSVKAEVRCVACPCMAHSWRAPRAGREFLEGKGTSRFCERLHHMTGACRCLDSQSGMTLAAPRLDSAHAGQTWPAEFSALNN